MADNELDAAVIKATQQALGKYIKKPPLTEKLLKKPPFRFLMDIFNTFIKQTGCFEGLYTPEEQQFENIHDREDKLRYLQKMIDAIKLSTKKELKVRTSKIVAGHEPQHTNEMLQQLATVAELRLDWESAVEDVLTAAIEANAAAKAKESKARESKPKEAKVAAKNISPTSKEERPKRGTNDKVKDKRISPQEQKLRKPKEQTTCSSPPTSKEKSTRHQKPETKPTRQSSKSKSPSPVKPTLKSKQQTSTESETVSISPVQAQPAIVKADSPKTSAETVKVEAAVPRDQHAVKLVEQPSAELTKDTENRKTSAQRRSSASSNKSRRSSASQRAAQETETHESLQAIREGPTQPAADTNNNDTHNKGEVKRENTFTRESSKDSTNSQRPRTSLRPPSARPASARPGAPRRRDRNVEIVLLPNDQIKMSGINVKLETFGDFDDDGENLVIIEDANAHDIAAGVPQQDTPSASELDAAQQGHLVQQILETQKELVQHPTEPSKEEQLNNLGARQSSARQMNGLRDVIQNLTKSVNPFGKLMDFIPEDIDAMQLELSMWRDTYTQAAAELKRERNLTDSATEPMKQQLVQIEGNIREYLELADASRLKILQNNERILKMLMEQ